MGDPAFDVAFCLNHLALKSVHVAANRAPLLAAMTGFRAAHAAGIDWEPPAALEARVAALVPGLMLARIDGKSPVEYLDPGARSRVRALSRALLADPPDTVATLCQRLAGMLKP
jgi:hypothetical protein